MLQNLKVSLTRKDEKLFLRGWGADYKNDDDTLWFVSSNTASLICVDRKSGNVKNVYQIPVEEIRKNDFIEIVIIEKDIYLIPYSADKIYCFNVETEKFAEIVLPFNKWEEKCINKFYKVFYVNEALYLIGRGVNCVLKYDLKEKKIKKIEGWKGETGLLSWQCVAIDDYIYIACAQENAIIKIHAKDDSWEKLNVYNVKDMGFDKIFYSNQKMHLIDKNSNKFYCDMDVLKSNVKDLEMRFVEQMSRKVYRVFCYNGKEYYFYLNEYEIDVVYEDGTYRQIAYDFSELMEGIKYDCYDFIFSKGSRIYWQIELTGDVYILDMENDTVQKIKLSIENQSYDEMVERAHRKRKRGIITESHSYNVKNLCRYINEIV